MLNITASRSSAGARQYFSDHLAPQTAEKENYYLGRPEDREHLPGEWGGLGAEMLGLSGEVRAPDFAALLENRRPGHEERLTARDDIDRRPGYDFTFNAPKSFSVMLELGHDRRLDGAFNEAVKETMREIEAGMKTRVRRDGQNRDRVTANMLWAKFDHRTARPVGGVSDPHRHAHVYAVNATYDGAEERWKAAQFGDLKRAGEYYEAVFHSHLSRRVSELGYAVERAGKFWEISGLPCELTDKFSRRTGQIERAAEERGITDTRRRAELGKYTRSGKDEDALTAAERESAWRSRLTGEERATLARLRETARRRKMAINREAMTAERAVDHAVAHCFERRSVVGEKVILAEALRAGFSSLTAGEVGLEGRRRINRGEWVAPEVGRGTEQMVTTREVLAEERRMLELERAGRGRFPALAPDYRPVRGDRLTPEQSRAVELVAASRDGVICVRGAAGTGKTTLMREVKEAVEAAGRGLHAFAPTAGAADMLRKDGFEGAETVARLLVDRKLQEAARGRVLLVDEAGLLGVGAMRGVLELARRQGCRVILSGDTRQHKSVERGDALRLLIEHGGARPAEVTGIRRQRAAEFREAVREISEQKIGAAFDRLERLGLIVEVRGDGPRHESLARDYLEAIGEGKTALVVAPTHREGRQVTEVLRAGLRERGALSPEEREVPRLVNTQWTRAERAVGRLYEPGMVVEFHARCGDFRRGERASVAGRDGEGRILVERDYGTVKVRDRLPLAEAEKFAVFRREQIGLAAGDLLRITRNGKTLEGARINNGSLVRVKEVSDAGRLVLENGRTLRGDHGHLDYGYAVTSQAAQGKTVDRTFAAVGEQSLPAATREGFYVTNSRSREFTRTYVDDLAAYREAVTGERGRLSALELVGRGYEPERGQSIGAGREGETAVRRSEPPRQQQERAPSHEPDRGYGFGR